MIALIETAATAPARISRAYLDNRKVKQELERGESAITAAGAQSDRPSDSPAASVSSSVVSVSADESEGARPSVESLRVASGAHTARVSEYLLSVLQDDGSAQFATIQATLRKAKEDGEKGQMTNEVLAVGDLFTFAQAGGSVELRDDEAA